MSANVTGDGLSVVGTATGAFLVLVGMGTLVGTPWQYADSAVVMLLQVLGTLAALAIGAALVWLVVRT